MNDCNKIVLDVYNHPDVLKLISKIKPASIRDDLHQEIAVSLLEQPCERIASLFSENSLLSYTMKVCWIMATSKTSGFYYKYKKSDIIKAVEYLRTTQPMPEIPITIAHKAKDILSKKGIDVYSDHEVRVFNKYVELGSSRAVSRYYDIPLNHVCNIVNKVKAELKCILYQ